MLRAEDNKFLTESGSGTAMGELLRRFWLPVLLSEELPEADGAPKKLVVMGEELLAFRDSRGADSARVVHERSAQQRAWALPQEGSGECRVPVAPAASCAKVKSTRVRNHGHAGNHPAFPAQWF